MWGKGAKRPLRDAAQRLCEARVAHEYYMRRPRPGLPADPPRGRILPRGPPTEVHLGVRAGWLPASRVSSHEVSRLRPPCVPFFMVVVSRRQDALFPRGFRSAACRAPSPGPGQRPQCAATWGRYIEGSQSSCQKSSRCVGWVVLSPPPRRASPPASGCHALTLGRSAADRQTCRPRCPGSTPPIYLGHSSPCPSGPAQRPGAGAGPDPFRPSTPPTHPRCYLPRPPASGPDPPAPPAPRSPRRRAERELRRDNPSPPESPADRRRPEACARAP